MSYSFEAEFILNPVGPVNVANIVNVAGQAGSDVPRSPGAASCGYPYIDVQDPELLTATRRGEQEIGEEILTKIGREFGKSIEWLLTGAENRCLRS